MPTPNDELVSQVVSTEESCCVSVPYDRKYGQHNPAPVNVTPTGVPSAPPPQPFASVKRR